MEASPGLFDNNEASGRTGDRLAMVLMLLASIGALFAFVGAAATTRDAGTATVVVESWRMFGFLVFAGIFLLLALRPLLYPGLWELAILHKAGMAILGAVLVRSDAAGAGTVAVVDGILVVMIIAAYVLARGYRSWQRW